MNAATKNMTISNVIVMLECRASFLTIHFLNTIGDLGSISDTALLGADHH